MKTGLLQGHGMRKVRRSSRGFHGGIVLFVLILLLTTLATVPENASALTTITFTSTADFDGGVKSDYGASWFVHNAVDQPTYSFISQPASVYANGRTYSIYQGGSRFLPNVTYYDHASGTWATPVQLTTFSSTGNVSDGHGAPSMFIDNDGFLYAACCAHSSTFQLFRSASAYSISSWVRKDDPSGTFGTYPSWTEYNDVLRFIYRFGNPQGGVWRYRNSTDGATTFAPAQTFVDFTDGGGTHGTYIGGKELVGSKLYFTMTKLIGTSRFNVYAAYLDFATGHVHSVSGVDQGITISEAEADVCCRILNSGTSTTNENQVHVLGGNVYVIYNEGLDSTKVWRTNFTFWNGVSWSAQVTITTHDQSSNYVDFIVDSTTSIDAFITTGGFATDVASGDMELWHWNGATWSKTRTIFAQGQSGDAYNHNFATAKWGDGLNRPHVPLYHQSPVDVIFDQWDGNQGNNVFLKMYAWSRTSGFLRNPSLDSGTNDIETSTDNAAVASGSFELASMKGDTFSTAKSNGETFKWNPFGRGSNENTCSEVIAAGKAYLNISAAGTECGFSSIATISGNFDVRIKMIMDVVASSNQRTLCVFNVSFQCSNTAGAWGVGTDGVFLRNLVGTVLSAFTVVNGVETQRGSNTNPGCGDGQFWHRLNRTGTSWTSSYSCNGSSWTSDETFTFSAPSSLYAMATIVQNGATGGTVTADDWQVTAGTVDAGGYQRNGTWTSPVQTYTTEIPRFVNLSFSGVTTAKYIDRVRILSSSGSVLFSDDTDITSGTSKSIGVTPELAGEDWKLDVRLVGDGSGTPTVESISILTAPAMSLLITRYPGRGIAPLNVTFVSLLSGGVGPFTYLWTFGDGWTSSSANTTHVYADPGTYTVTLNVTGSDGNSVEETLTVTVLPSDFWMTMILIFLAFLFLTVVGFLWSPVFHVIGGLVGFYLAVSFWTDLVNLPMSLLVLAWSLFMFFYGVMGVIRDPEAAAT